MSFVIFEAHKSADVIFFIVGGFGSYAAEEISYDREPE